MACLTLLLSCLAASGKAARSCSSLLSKRRAQQSIPASRGCLAGLALVRSSNSRSRASKSASAYSIPRRCQERTSQTPEYCLKYGEWAYTCANQRTRRSPVAYYALLMQRLGAPNRRNNCNIAKRFKCSAPRPQLQYVSAPAADLYISSACADTSE